MAVLKCKMCGGDVVLAADKTFGTCEYCGCTMTFPKVNDDQRAAAFNRGNHFRRIGEFDKALEVYERIVAEDENDAEAHWCCALCRFGIEYVEDPTTYEWLPTCHRASFDSFLEDVDFLSALEHSDGVTRRQYQRDAAKIAEVQRGILATSQNTEPYDVFICYKELDENGNRTRDSILAQEIYYRLKDRDWRVFFSRISLEDVPGTQYEPYIFAALNSALVMVVVGTSAENLNSVWVKNEWSRFLSLMKKDRSKLLIPCYRDMDPYDLPDQLSVLMSYDIGRIGFIQDLIRGVDKVLSAEKKDSVTETVKETVVVQQGGGPNVTALIKRGNLALEDGEWESANNFFDQALNMDAECAEAYLGQGLAEQKCHDTEEYIKRVASRAVQTERKYISRNEDRIRKARETYPVEGFLKWEELKDLYEYDLGYNSTVKAQKVVQNRVIADFEKDRYFARAERFSSEEVHEPYNIFRKKLIDRLKRDVEEAQSEEKREITRLEIRYDEFLNRADQKAEIKYNAALQNREEHYLDACRLQEKATDIYAYQAAISKFQSIKTYKDSLERIKECGKSISDLEELEKLRIAEEKRLAAEKAEQERQRREEERRLAAKIAAEKAEQERSLREQELLLKRKRNQKKKTIVMIIIVVAMIVVASFFVGKQFVVTAQQRSSAYQKAAELYASGDYVAAYSVYSTLRGYKDVDTLLRTDKYLLAVKDAREAKLSAWKTVGNTVSFGHYEQDNNTANGKEDIEWIVVANEKNKSLIISRFALDCRQYNRKNTDVTWELCSLRAWLNQIFLESAFSSEEQQAILVTEVDSSKSQGNSVWSTNGGKNTEDKVFLFSYAEAELFFSSNTERICIPTAYATAQGAYISSNGNCRWWLRSPGYRQSYVAAVNAGGSLDYNKSVQDNSNAVRPALWVDLDQIAGNISDQEVFLPHDEKATSDLTTSVEPLYSSELKVGDIYTFGSYEQDNNPDNGKEPIEWIVLVREENHYLLISRYALDCQQYNTTNFDVTWENCSMRSWLNGSFLNEAFSSKEQQTILKTKVNNSESQGNSKWSSGGGNNSDDQIFLLSYAEAEKYFGSDNDRICKPTAYAKAQGAYDKYSDNCRWWLRSPGILQSHAALITARGSLGYDDYIQNERCAVRPAFWIDLDQIAIDSSDQEISPSLLQTSAGDMTTNSEPLYSCEFKIGDIYTFGSYEQDNNPDNGKEPIEWIVLDNTGNKSLLISRYALDCQPYNTKLEDVTWETSSLRTWLNGVFLNAAFSADEQKAVMKTSVNNSKSQGNGEWSSDGGNNTSDQIFLLSYAEAGKYFDSDNNRICEPTAYTEAKSVYTDDSWNCRWWLRSPGYNLSCAAYVRPYGALGYYYSVIYDYYGVRPAFWINLESEYFK